MNNIQEVKVNMSGKKVAVISSSILAFLALSSLVGLAFTGKYVGWGPFKNLFWGTEVKRMELFFMEQVIFVFGRKGIRIYLIIQS